MRVAALALTIPLLGATQPQENLDGLTLAQASRMRPRDLAERLLGEAGRAGGFVEARVNGNGGGYILTPGLNSVELYKRTASAGFAGLCSVEGVTVQFSSTPSGRGNQPKHVVDFWKVMRFAVLMPERLTNNDVSNEQDRRCATLSPIRGQALPAFFAVGDDRPVTAHFAMRALMRARERAATLSPITCSDRDEGRSVCDEPARSLASLPIQAVHLAKVERCSGHSGWCVEASWYEHDKTRQVDALIRTDATQVDPPVPFDVVAVSIEAGSVSGH